MRTRRIRTPYGYCLRTINVCYRLEPGARGRGFLLSPGRTPSAHFNKIVAGGPFAAFCRAKRQQNGQKTAIRPQTTSFSGMLF
jgi:hypothetical protein